MRTVKDRLTNATVMTPPESPEDKGAPPLAGAALIADTVKRLPGKPGVYRMIGAKGDVLYVGKA